MILIGSRALAIRAPELLDRKPKDFDWVCTQEECDKWLSENRHKLEITKEYAKGNKYIVEGPTPLEFEICSPGDSGSLLREIVFSDPATVSTRFGEVPSLNVLYTLKSSHRYAKQPHFWKTMLDYHRMRSVGCEANKELLKLRESETYKTKTPSLTNQTKESFFNEAHGVKYTYDHDSLHEAVKHLDKPAYQYYAKDNDPIKSDKTKFFNLPQEYRLYGALEECSVLCLERALVPHPDQWDNRRKAWNFAFMKMMNGIVGGFFRDWCYDNALEILSKYPEDFYDKFEKGLANGTVRKA